MPTLSRPVMHQYDKAKPSKGLDLNQVSCELLFILYMHMLFKGVFCVCAFVYFFISVCRRDCRLLCLFLLEQMSGSPYVGFADGASRSTRNLSSAAWVIYDPHGELVDIQGVCLGCTTNNVAEYSVVI